jgi:hypothetical protein
MPSVASEDYLQSLNTRSWNVRKDRYFYVAQHGKSRVCAFPSTAAKGSPTYLTDTHCNGVLLRVIAICSDEEGNCSDFQQYYSGEVISTGSLKLKVFEWSCFEGVEVIWGAEIWVTPKVRKI